MIAPYFEAQDSRFHQLVPGSANVDRLWTGARWAEGPAYVPAARALLFSDIPNDRVMRFDEPSGTVTRFSGPDGYQNGRTVDRQGRVIACEHGGRCVSRIEHNGTSRVLAASFQGKRLNSPNDVVVKSDGSIWFTDPTYGIDSDYEGHRGESEIGGSYVYRIAPDNGDVTAVATDFAKPNGLAFNADETRLYVSDTGISHAADGPRHIRVLDVASDGKSLISGDTVFATCTPGVYDGFRFDAQGNLWTSAGDGVHIYAPDGDLIGKICLPEAAANLEFGGPKRNRLYICATTSLYALYLHVSGAGPTQATNQA